MRHEIKFVLTPLDTESIWPAGCRRSPGCRWSSGSRWQRWGTGPDPGSRSRTFWLCACPSAAGSSRPAEALDWVNWGDTKDRQFQTSVILGKVQCKCGFYDFMVIYFSGINKHLRVMICPLAQKQAMQFAPAICTTSARSTNDVSVMLCL